jgi:hypothetical protein
MSEEEKAQYRAKLREQFGGGRPGPLAAQQQSALAEQIATLKQQHKLSVGELQSIRQLALKEKATQTAQALEKLIAKQEDEHQKRLKGLEQRLQRMQAARSGGQTPDANAPSKPTDATRSQPGRQRQRPTTPRQQR